MIIDHGENDPLEPDLTGYGAVVDHIRAHHLRSAEMTPERAAGILERHNAWRRDDEGVLPFAGNGKEIGEAIDVLVAFVRKQMAASA